MPLENTKNISVTDWFRSGDPLIWLNAAAVSISVVAVVGLILLLAVKGFGHFWPADIFEAEYTIGAEPGNTVIGEFVESKSVSIEQIRSAGIEINTDEEFIERSLVKLGNKDVTGVDFSWVINSELTDLKYPLDLMAIERREWGNFYGYLKQLKEQNVLVADTEVDDSKAWQLFQRSIERVQLLTRQIEHIEKGEIGAINHSIERLNDQLQTEQISSQTSPIYGNSYFH